VNAAAAASLRGRRLAGRAVHGPELCLYDLLVCTLADLDHAFIVALARF
jgi:hypothetical protein